MVIQNRILSDVLTLFVQFVPMCILRRFTPPVVVAEDGHYADLW